VDGDSGLLRLELETLWTVDDRGRLTATRDAVQRPAPLVAVAAGDGALVWACSSAVSDDVVEGVGEILDRTPVDEQDVVVGWVPEPATELLGLLASTTALDRAVRGPSYVLTAAPDAPGARDGVELWSSTDTDVMRLVGLMPEADRHLVEPWVVAIVDGKVAAVCESARSAPAAAEAGVWTYEPYRRRGLATAVTAAWTALVGDRTVFYSTAFDNLGSQGVARRLGLRPLGQWWQVHAATEG
jgi:RimJ/RimL family protein N-acetyltransferase